MENKIINFFTVGAVIFSNFVGFAFFIISALVLTFVLLIIAFGFNIEQMSLIEIAAVVMVSVAMYILFLLDLKWHECITHKVAFDIFMFVAFTTITTIIVRFLMEINGVAINSPLGAIIIVVISMIVALLLIIGTDCWN